MATPHIVLLGFCCAGKTSLGRLLAARLGWKFVDIDQAIAQQAQQSTGQLCAHDEVRFRALEHQVLRRWLVQPTTAHVLACGGGSFAPAANRQLLLQHAVCVHLEVTLATSLQRAGEQPEVLRPKLQQSLPQVAALYAQRQAQFQQMCAYHLPTSDATLTQLVAALYQLLQPRLQSGWSLSPVHGPANPVQITNMQTLLRTCLAHLGSPKTEQPWLLVADRTLYKRYARPLQRRAHRLGMPLHLIGIEPGETGKSMKNLARLWHVMQRLRLQRQSVVLSLGGGSVSDIVGLAAATYLRGLRCVLIPTTTLAVVDASVGGKTSCNVGFYKNAIGTFTQPALNLLCWPFLRSQSQFQHACGLVELAKIAALCDAMLFTQLQCQAEPLAQPRHIGQFTTLLRRGITLKQQVCHQDFTDQHKRHALNAGHTLGHAMEAASHWQLAHGAAVGLGLLMEAALLRDVAGIADVITTGLGHLLTVWQLPSDWRGTLQRLGVAAVAKALQNDKKNHDDKVVLVGIPHIGSHRLFRFQRELVIKWLFSQVKL